MATTVTLDGWTATVGAKVVLRNRAGQCVLRAEVVEIERPPLHGWSRARMETRNGSCWRLWLTEGDVLWLDDATGSVRRIVFDRQLSTAEVE